VSESSGFLDKFFVNKKSFDPKTSVPIVYGMHYPGIITIFGVPYNDDSVKPPCYRVGDDPRVGFSTARWVEE
jgi:hypothetical protein